MRPTVLLLSVAILTTVRPVSARGDEPAGKSPKPPLTATAPAPVPKPSGPSAPVLKPPISPAPALPAQAFQAGVRVVPARVVLKGHWVAQTLQVTVALPDGSVRDFSGKAGFQVANPLVATVDAAGIVRPLGDGETAVLVVVSVGGDALARAEVPVTVQDVRNDAVDFGSDVMALVSRLGCNASACHGAPRGKGGLKLSLFGADPDDDHAALTLAAHGRRVNRVEPARSLLLTKPGAVVPHGGGQKVPPGSPDHALLAAWIAQGTPRGAVNTPGVVSLQVTPAVSILSPGETQQCLVTAVLSDGSRRDVTREALFKSSNVKVATAASGGGFKAEGYGEAAVVVNYLRQPAVARVVVPQPLAGAFPIVPVNNRIDELVFAKLKTLGIPPSDLCSDAVFLRRVYLDAIGTLPTAGEARAFLADKDPNRRARVIDQLLQRREFADFWALKWGDLLRIKSEYPVNVWPKAVHVYYRWLRESLAQNKPYDQMVRELLTAGGSNFRVPPANFFRAMPGRNPQSFAETTALVFMGARVNCAHCHAHPSETWTRDDNLGLSAFFSKVTFKATQEWKEEIVFFIPDGGLWNMRSRQLVKPKPLGAAPLELEREDDPRARFAAWLTTPENPWFAPNVVNRIWYWLLGRGIVHDPDDMRPTNPPENPELLDYLRRELVVHKFDLKHIYRLIFNSRVYQLSCEPNAQNEKDLSHFSHYRMKRLTAEQMLDGICQVTGSQESFTSWIPVPVLRMPQTERAIQLPDSDIDSAFLDLFGRPSRDTPFETERNCEAQPRQALYFVSSDELQYKIAGGQKIRQLFETRKADPEIVDELYLSALSRPPRGDEKQKALAYLAKGKNARVQAVQDLFWAILTTKEFMVNH